MMILWIYLSVMAAGLIFLAVCNFISNEIIKFYNRKIEISEDNIWKDKRSKFIRESNWYVNADFVAMVVICSVVWPIAVIVFICVGIGKLFSKWMQNILEKKLG